MKKCILVLTVNVENWGAEKSICSLCHYLQQQGKKVIVVIPREGSIVNLLKDINVEWIVQEYGQWCTVGDARLSLYWKLRGLYRAEKKTNSILRVLKKKGLCPELVYSSTITFGTGLRIAQKLKIPHVQHIRENIDAFGFKFKYGYQLTMWYINHLSNRIICTCNAIRDRYVNDVNPEHIIAIHNGVPPVDTLPTKIFTGKLMIMQIARFMDDKRVIDSLYAIKNLVNQGITNIQLDLYGKGPEQELYEEYIESNQLSSYVKIKGFVQTIDFVPYHIGLMTSTFEAFARSTLDYMNNGLAVIASDTGGNLEQVVDGETGILYKVNNVESLTDAIKTLYLNRNQCSQMSEFGRKRFLYNFSQEKYVTKVGGEILRLICKN